MTTKTKNNTSPKTGTTAKPKTYKEARVNAVKDAVNKPAVDQMVRELKKVNTPKARDLTEGELKFLTAGTYRADYIRKHLQLGWDATKGQPRKQKAGEGWESIVRLGAENKSLGGSQYLSFKTQCQQALDDLNMDYSLQGAGAKQLVNLKPKRVSKGGSKGKDNTQSKDKPSANSVETWVSNILAGLKEHEVEELVFDLADSIAPISQQALLSHLMKEHADWFLTEVQGLKKAS